MEQQLKKIAEPEEPPKKPKQGVGEFEPEDKKDSSQCLDKNREDGNTICSPLC